MVVFIIILKFKDQELLWISLLITCAAVFTELVKYELNLLDPSNRCIIIIKMYTR